MSNRIIMEHCTEERKNPRSARGPRGSRMESCLPVGDGRVVAFAADWESVDRLRAWAAAVGLDGRFTVHHRDGRPFLAGGDAGADTNQTRLSHSAQGARA